MALLKGRNSFPCIKLCRQDGFLRGQLVGFSGGGVAAPAWRRCRLLLLLLLLLPSPAPNRKQPPAAVLAYDAPFLWVRGPQSAFAGSGRMARKDCGHSPLLERGFRMDLARPPPPPPCPPGPLSYQGSMAMAMGHS